MNDPRILIISDIGCGPPWRGNRMRMRRLLAEIKKMGFEICFAGVRMSDREKESLSGVVDEWMTNFTKKPPVTERAVKRIRKRLGIPGKNSGFQYNSNLNVEDVDCRFEPSWEEEVRKIQDQYQFKRVLVPYIYNSAFLELLSDVPVRIIDTHDTFTDRNIKLKSIGVDQYWFSVSRDEERKALERATHVLAIQEEEGDLFRQMVSKEVEVTEVKHFTNPSGAPAGTSKRHQFGFIGSDNPLSRDSFLWFADEVLPVIKAKHPEASCVVAGTVCNTLPESGLYKMLGRVDNAEDFYVHCSFTINPVRVGTGLKIKTIESLEHSRPVISTGEGARGLNDFINAGLTVCHTKEEFTEAVIRHLKDQPSTDLIKSIQDRLLAMNRQSAANLRLALNPDAY